ncbi:ABC transporter permease [Actinopolyspora xinjiangensis]|nr:ABC transporter permease [Actinopolyspora xinjiangensis]
MLRRELATKLWTSAFALSTALFALLAFAVPLLSGENDDPPTLAHTDATSALATTAAGLDDQLTLKETASGSDGRTLLSNGEADAVLVPGEGDREGFRVLVEDSLDQQLATTLRSALRDQALRQAAAENGVDADALARDLRTASLSVVTTGEKIDMTGVLTGLSFAAGALLIILLWGIPLATDVMQEKASRVVEILLTSVRPWQLLAGKVVAITLIGLVQLIVILGSAIAGIALGGQLPDLDGTSAGVVAVGAVCLVFSIVTCGTLMAGLAARVERQEDLNSALQPAMAATLLPMAAAFYLVFDSTDSRLLDAASMAPVFNMFVLPPRLAIESVPIWQLTTSFAVALLTVAAAFWIAGRIYSGSVLRSGGSVPLHEAVRNR